MLSSLARYLEPLPDDEGDPFLTQIQALFQTDFISKQLDHDQEEEEEEEEEEDGENGDAPGDHHDQPTGSERPGGAGSESIGSGSGAEWEAESESSPVLHLGSVLLTGHDYLL